MEERVRTYTIRDRCFKNVINWHFDQLKKTVRSVGLFWSHRLNFALHPTDFTSCFKLGNTTSKIYISELNPQLYLNFKSKYEFILNFVINQYHGQNQNISISILMFLFHNMHSQWPDLFFCFCQIVQMFHNYFCLYSISSNYFHTVIKQFSVILNIYICIIPFTYVPERYY